MDLQTALAYRIFMFLHLLSEQLHTVTAPSIQFHIKLNTFQQLAYLLVAISEILSKTVLLEMGFKNENLQYTPQKFVGFITRNCGIMVTNNQYLPYDSTGNVTHRLYIANYILTAKCNIQYKYQRNMENANV
jgi:hypothetical protein